jgi:CHAT domain-containing protein/tetratricopeptide (TPR) repeat protein
MRSARGTRPGLAAAGCCLLLAAAPALSGQLPQPACDLLGSDCAVIRRAIEDNRLQDAAGVAERALAAAQQTDAGSLQTAQAIDMYLWVRCMLGLGRDVRPLDLAEQAVAIRTRLQGEMHPDLIESQHNLVLVLRQKGELKRALQPAEQALSIAEATSGPGSAPTVHCLNELSAAQTMGGDPPAGLKSAERALELAESLTPQDPLLVAESLSVVATPRFQRGDAAGAAPLLRKALENREAVLPPDHPLVARAAMNLGVALRATGERGEGEKLLRRALGIYTRAAPDHPDVLYCLNSLALIARSRADYVEARRLWERALEVGVRELGEEHPSVAGLLNNLATLRKLMGDYQAAQALLARSLAIRERVRGADHPEVAQALNNLAQVQIQTGEYAQARASAERSVKIREKAFGPHDPQVGASLATLGEALFLGGDLAGASSVYERSVADLETAGGTMGQDLATALVGLAAVRHQSGDLDVAAQLYERALKLEEELLAPTHPRVGELLVRFGLLEAQRGETRRAFGMALRAEEIAREHLRLTCRYLSEREGLAYAVTRSKGLDLALSLVAAHPEGEDAAKVLTALARSRTLVLDEAIARSRRAKHPASPEVRKLQEDVTVAAEELVTLLVKGPGKEGAEKYRSAVEAARERLEQAERAVAGATAGTDLAATATTWLELRDGLPPSSSMVAFTRYNQEPLAFTPGGVAVTSYLALVLSAGSPGPAVVPLGPAEEIETSVRAWQALLARGYARGKRQAADEESSCRLAGQRVRRATWDPLTPRLGQVERVFIVPEGSLNLVHFDALPREDGGYLIEGRPAIHQLTAEKDLLVAQREDTRGRGLLAMGGVAFDESNQGRRAAAQPDSEVRSVTEPAACLELASVHFAPLPHTDAEVKEVGRLYRRAEATKAGGASAVVLRGKDATEVSFRTRAPGMQILHLATHGFFLGELCRLSEPSTRGIGGLVSTTAAAPTAQVQVSPLLLAGLALAGANQRATASSPADDGILTAEEIGLLDLGGVEWAVLSACDSGAGTVAIGEGVLGLRRAFLIAGAHSVIMSLWAVDDAAASEWMGALYEARLGRGLSTADAVREASLRLLQQRRARGLTTHPFYWAPFVAAGDWR